MYKTAFSALTNAKTKNACPGLLWTFVLRVYLSGTAPTVNCKVRSNPVLPIDLVSFVQ